MVFGVSFAISIDEENLRWTKTTWPVTISRVIIGLLSTAGLDYIIRLFL